MIQNMHIHSSYSWDSKMKLEEIASYLVEKNIKYAGITDHVEFNVEHLQYVLTKLKIRNLEIDHLNDKYEGKIKLLKAVEISSPHLYPEKVAALQELELDYIMGSIHKIDRHAKTTKEKIDVYYKYYNDIIEMLKNSEIDVLGHLDYIRRYYPEDYSSMSQINEIISLLQKKNIIMEINTSASRRISGSNYFPSIEKLALYSKNNSEVIIGTDAHTIEELDDNLTGPEKDIETFNLKPIIFEKRKKLII